METARDLGYLIIMYMYFAHYGHNTRADTNSSCLQAVPPVNDSTKNAACISYNYPVNDGLCKNIISSLYVFGDNRTLADGEKKTDQFQQFFKKTIARISEKCKPIMIDLYCRYHFPPCDVTLSEPQPRRICRSSCEYLDKDLCKEEMILIRQTAEAVPVLDMNMINCSLYDVANGGNSPECYQYHSLPGDDTKSTDCYYGIGVGYRGNVNVTRSGLACQPWTSQCPHRHWRIPEDAVDGQDDFNMCRNPDSSGPDGPWCYTTDPKVRWEYCNVSRCPPRVPEMAPAFLRGYPLNSTAIRISWKSLPPSRYKEQLLGYRVKYRLFESEMYQEINVTRNSTEAVLKGVPQTKYNIEVNGFNEIGHGSSSKVLVIKTLSPDEITVDVNFQLVIDTDFNYDLLNHSSETFMATEDNIRMVLKNHFNKSTVLKVYDVRVLEFRSGSVQADIKVLIVINGNLTNRAEALKHLMNGMESALEKELKATSIIILEKPQPIEELKATIVQTRYIVISWEPPSHQSFYHIHNYTIERKTKLSDNYTVMQTLPYTQTRMTMKDLKPATEYTVRLSCSNKYGRSDGVLLTQSTLPDRFIRDFILIFVLPFTLAVLFIITVCFKFRSMRKLKPKPYEKELVMRGNWLELPGTAITLQEKLGEGAFGEAYKGLVQIDGQWRTCAVKKLKDNATEREKRDLLNELQIMVTVGEHPNVISLIGACTTSESILVVVRLAENGCLLKYLTKNRENPYINVGRKQPKLTHMEKVRIARDIASGMLHLASKKCVHRDLAARNVLLGENNVAMVSDFGLSRDVYESGEYESTSGGLLPVRWMAPESLEDYTYNTKTDVWSFGVVLWEIESGGKMPYPGLGGMEVLDYIKSGRRLKQPDECPDKMYEIMTSCWRLDPSQRPSFSELVTSLDNELHSKTQCVIDKNIARGSQECENVTKESDD